MSSSSTAALEQRLTRLEDERAILQVLYRYAHAIDYGLEQEYADLWTQDAILRWPARDPLVGRAAILAAYRAHTHAPEKFHKHFLSEPRIEVSGDRATCDSYFARLDDYPEGPQIRSFGRYRDVLVREHDGRWRLSERAAEREARRTSGYATPDGSDG